MALKRCTSTEHLLLLLLLLLFLAHWYFIPRGSETIIIIIIIIISEIADILGVFCKRTAFRGSVERVADFTADRNPYMQGIGAQCRRPEW